MSLTRLFRLWDLRHQLTGRPAHRTRSAKRLPHALSVEPLEDRFLPSAFTWIKNGNGNWNSSGNWSPSGFPNAVDDVANFTSTAITVNPRVTIPTSGITAGTITFDSNQNYTLKAKGGGQLVLDTSSGNAALTVTNVHGNGSQTISAPITLNDPLVISNNSTGTLTLSGAIGQSGTEGITVTGSGTVAFFGTNTYTGTTSIKLGTLQVDGSQASSPVSLNGGTLAGTGTVGTITATVTGGTVRPGSTGTGILSSGNVALNSASSYAVRLNGTTAGTGYDQLNVTGTVSLTGCTLTAALGFSSAVGDSFTIINNDGSDAVTGTFNGLAEGATLTLNGEHFQITYVGGTGNDVVLTHVNSAPVVTNPGSQSTNEGTVVLLPISASDPDTLDTLTYTATGLPPGLSINSSTGAISGTLTNQAAGSYTVTVTATDPHSASASTTFGWTVNDVTTPTVTSPGTQNSNEGAAVALGISASDADGDPLAYSASGLPTGLSINASTGVISGTIGNQAANGSPYTVTVSASDSHNTGSTTFTWNVMDITTPVVTNPGTRTNNEGATVSLAVSASVAGRQRQRQRWRYADVQRQRPASRPEHQCRHRGDLRDDRQPGGGWVSLHGDGVGQ